MLKLVLFIDLTVFQEEFNRVLSKIGEQHKLCYLIGDFNIKEGFLLAESFYPLIN